MKHNAILVLASLTALTALTGCNGGAKQEGQPTLKGVELVTPDDEMNPKRSGQTLQLLFKSSSEIPYISLNDAFGFLSTVKAIRVGDTSGKKAYYTVTNEGAKFVASNDQGVKTYFDPENQTISYEDLDAFCTFRSEQFKPLSILDLNPNAKCLKVVRSDYKKGHAVTVDLKPFSRVDLLTHESKLYMPLSTFNDFFYNVFEYGDFAYNYKDLYIIPNGSLKSNLFGIPMLTGFGESFYSGPKKATLSDELKEFNYQESCLNFDYFYGLKKEKGFTSFDSFLTDEGFKNDLLSSDVKVSDATFRYALSYLNDGHAAGTEASSLYEYGEAIDDKNKYSPDRTAWEKYGEALEGERKKAGISTGNVLDAVGKVYYITFDSFTQINEDLLYMGAETETGDELIAASTASQFHSAYSFLTDEANKGKANTVVVDLLTNGGGSADSLVYSLCTLLGEVNTMMQNPFTGGENRTTFKADLNLDGKIDEKDVGLIQKGYNVVFLNSKATFSCGNALPAIAKANNAKVMTIGETSGGGTCVVRPSMSPLCASYSMSGVSQISVEKEGKLVNIESGVPADHAVTRENFFSRDFLSAMINSWIGQ